VFRSLRFRLPALFLAGIALSGVVATALAVQLFQDYVRDREVAELQDEARGIARLYAEKAGDIPFPAASLEDATGDSLFFVPRAPGLLQEELRLTVLPADAVPPSVVGQQRPSTFTFSPPGEDRRFLAAAYPLVTVDRKGAAPTYWGAIIAATPEAELRARLLVLVWRLAIGALVGLVVAGLLGWYLSRRITRPVLALAEAADEVALGHYDVDVPDTEADDEVGHLARRFQEMAWRLGETEERERHFLMSVSHELRTPLTAIRGHVEALREGVVEDPDSTAFSLDVIAAEAQRLERLVGDVLDLAKLNAHRFTVLHEEVDMERLLEHAYSAFGEEARRREIDYERRVGAKPVIVTDGDRVLQIVTNLLRNAFRWTPDGGRIELELTAENGCVSVAVGDSGPGISAADRERIFRPFWSRDDSGGTGLGLPIARELARALGGRIELETRPGRGSRFELVLPAGGS
jgi:signal transduction histidine kinase